MNFLATIMRRAQRRCPKDRILEVGGTIGAFTGSTASVVAPTDRMTIIVPPRDSTGEVAEQEYAVRAIFVELTGARKPEAACGVQPR